MQRTTRRRFFVYLLRDQTEDEGHRDLVDRECEDAPEREVAEGCEVRPDEGDRGTERQQQIVSRAEMQCPAEAPRRRVRRGVRPVSTNDVSSHCPLHPVLASG